MNYWTSMKCGKKEKDDNMAFVKEIFGRLPFSRNA